MLPNRFLYRSERSRTISVHPEAIRATLRTIYPGAPHFAEEPEVGERGE